MQAPSGEVVVDGFGLGFGEPLALEVDDLGVEIDVLDAVDVGGSPSSSWTSAVDSSSTHRGAHVATPDPCL